MKINPHRKPDRIMMLVIMIITLLSGVIAMQTVLINPIITITMMVLPALATIGWQVMNMQFFNKYIKLKK